MHTVYAVRCNVDTTEGRGPMVVKCLADNPTTAQAIADKLEPYGHSGQFNNVEPMIMFSSLVEYNEYQDGAVKRAALTKLNDVEKKVLGLI
jgi:hypothetical protein